MAKRAVAGVGTAGASAAGGPPCTRELTVSVVGYVETAAGGMSERGGGGSGKSCLCSRFVRPLADEYERQHSSILAAADFSGPVVNNDHFLYWGSAARTSDDGIDCSFHVIEQTEFVDDQSFQPFRGGKGSDGYLKRCSQTKLQSAEKLMYICRNQLGMEEKYEKRSFPNGKVTIDGFVCVFDVNCGGGSGASARRLQRQVEFVTAVLGALVKTKKPIVLATTKHDAGDASEAAVQEALRLSTRKEFKGAIVGVVETSAHLNINVDTVFMLLAAVATAGDSSGLRPSRPKVLSYVDAARARAEVLAVATEAYICVLRSHVRDYRAQWLATARAIDHNPDYCHYVELHGAASAQRQFKSWTRQLREEAVTRRRAVFAERLPAVLKQLLPDLTAIAGRSWTNCQRVLATRSDFNEYFVVAFGDQQHPRSWMEDDTILEGPDTRLPFDYLASSEGETAFKNHVNALQAEQRRLEMRKQFRHLLEANPNVTAGKQLNEVAVFFLGRDCYDQLSEADRRDVYSTHQTALREVARRDLQELLYERSELFGHYDDPDAVVTQADMENIVDALRTDARFRALARCEEDRKVALLNHLCFLQYPVRDQCPFRNACMETIIQNCLAAKAKRQQVAVPTVSTWCLNPDEKNVNLVLIGSDNLATELVHEIRSQCADDQYVVGSVVHNLDYRPIDGDVSLPHNALDIPTFPPDCYICVYSSHDTLEYLRDAMSKTLLAPAESSGDVVDNDKEDVEDKGGIMRLRSSCSVPMVVVLAYDHAHTEKGLLLLRDEGRELAAQLQCPFVDVPDDVLDGDETDAAPAGPGGSGSLGNTHATFFANQVQMVLSTVVKPPASLDGVDGGVGNGSASRTHPDLRILMCLMCGDGMTVETMLQPIFSVSSCQIVSNDRYHVLHMERTVDSVEDEDDGGVSSYPAAAANEGERKKAILVEVLVASYHEASLLKDELCHGCILVYSAKRKASYSVMSLFASKVLDLPLLVVAHCDSMPSETSTALVDLGRAHADKCHAAFALSSQFSQSDSASFGALVREAWEQKRYTERAIYGGQPGQGDDEGRCLSDSMDRRHAAGDQQLPPYSSPNGTLVSSASGGARAGNSNKQPAVRLENDYVALEQMASSQPQPRKQWNDSKNSMYLGVGADGKSAEQRNSKSSSPAGSSSPVTQTHRRTLSAAESERARAPLAEMDAIEISDYAEPLDAVSMHSGDNGDYALVQDALPAGRIQRVVSSLKRPVQQLPHVPGAPEGSTSPSNERRSQQERYQAASAVSSAAAVTGIAAAVAAAASGKSPSTRRRGDQTEMTLSGSLHRFAGEYNGGHLHPAGVPADGGGGGVKSHSTGTMKSDTPSEGSDPGDDGRPQAKLSGGSSTGHPPVGHKRSFRLSRRRTDGYKDSSGSTNTSVEQDARPSSLPVHDAESSGGIGSSAHRTQSFLDRWKGSATDKEADRARRRGEKKAKEDEKLRQKEEREKEKEARRKKSARRSNRKSYVERDNGMSLQDYRQLEEAIVPKFVEHCIRHIESEGLEWEGIYRVPGHSAQVQQLKAAFEQAKEQLNIGSLQMSMNAVATAVKQFFSDLSEPLVPRSLYDELTLAASVPDGSGRLLALRGVLKKLPAANHDVLGFLMKHLNKIASHSEQNSMDSKNLAICWWPTLLRPQFASYEKMALISKCLEEIVQTVIEQYGFFFFNENEV